MFIYNINNLMLFSFSASTNHIYRSIADQFNTSFGFEQSDMNLFRLNSDGIHKKRDLFTKNSDLDTWNSIHFCHIPKRSKLRPTSTISFEEDLNITQRKPIGELITKALRTGMVKQ